jgi:hypothetical protein
MLIFRIFFFAATAAMMADNIEHVISYWVMFQKFHSPALGGFAVISHWVPFLLLAGFSGSAGGSLRYTPADSSGDAAAISAYRCAGASCFATDTVTLWKAMALLVVHGFAG